MHRIFVFMVSNLDFVKIDLNVPLSENRKIIGPLSRMITNAIFLSHSLRENVTIRIFVKKPFNHIIDINSHKIRYLGPELRSSASLLRKTENYLKEKKKDGNNIDVWFEPNPGLFAKITNKIFDDLEVEIKDSPIFLFKVTNDESNKKYVSLPELESLIKDKISENKSLIFILPIALELNELLSSQITSSTNLISITMKKHLLNPNLISLLNIILDENK